MDLFFEITTPISSRLVRLVFAAIIVVAATSAGRAQAPLDPGGGFREPSSRHNPPSAQTKPDATAPQPQSSANRLTRDEAVRLALSQASSFQAARYAELIAAEDVQQARAAFLPKLGVPSIVTYNSPALRPGTPAMPRAPGFIASNAVAEYQALAGASGELDLAGRLRASLRRSVALLEAARAGTEIARRTLIQAVDDSYFGLALATAKRGSAELSLNAANEFSRITELMFNAGEVAQVDVTRARLQAASRRDDFEQARVNETVAEGSLRVLVGYDFASPLEIVDLIGAVPSTAEIARFGVAGISRRPEFTQLDAARRAADQDAKAARAERLPQFLYTISGGFDTDSLRPDPLREHTGILAAVSLTIPIFDWGASKSRERQARFHSQSLESQRNLAVRSFTQQFYAAQAQARAAAIRYELLRASVVDAERNVQASLARYRSGEAPIIEVTDSLSTLAAQRAALYQALFDYQSARARLVQITGQ